MTETGWGSPPEPSQTGWGTPQPTPRRRRRPIAEIFEEVFRLYRQNFWLMVGIYALFQIPVVLAAVPLSIWQLQWSFGMFDPDSPFRPGSPPPLPSPDQAVLLVVAGLTLGIASLLLGTFAAAAMSYIVGRARNGDRPSAREVFLALRRLAGPIVVYCLLLLVGGALLVIGLVLAALVVGGLLVVGLGGGNAGGFVLLSFVLIFVVFVAVTAVAIRIALAIPVLVLERQRPMDAFRRSWNLVRGSIWRTFGIVVLTSLIVGLAAGLVSPLFLPGVMQGFLTGNPAAYVLLAVASGLVQIALGPILPAVVTVLYFDYAQPTA